jgi:perosamine synthetase
MAALNARGVDSRSFFYPMSQQPSLRDPAGEACAPRLDGSWPVSDDLGRRGLYLPSGIGLTGAQVRLCAETLRSLAR